MAGAPLDHADLGLGQKAQHLGGFLSHVLGPRVAGDVQVTPPPSGCRPGAKPSLRAMLTMYR